MAEKSVAVEEVFPVTIRDKFVVVIPSNIRKLLQGRGKEIEIGETIRMAIIMEKAEV